MPTVGIKSSLGSGQDVTRGLNPTQPVSSSDMAALMRLLAEKTEASIERRTVNPLMEFVYSSMTDGSRFVSHIPVACGKGCSFCCMSWVDVSPPEALFTVKNIPPAQRDRALASVEEACSITGGKSFADRCGKLFTRCPMLDHAGACSVYETRPVACRTQVSTNVDACRRTFVQGSDEVFPGLKVWLVLRDSYARALEGALIHARLAHQPREWNESLRIALTRPDAEQRWLAGSDEFSEAPASPAPPAFDNPLWRSIYRQAFGTPLP